MIKTTVKTKNQKITYPCLKVALKNLVVLFTDPKTGTVVACDDGEGIMGDHATNWAEYDFRPFSGSVTLANKE